MVAPSWAPDPRTSVLNRYLQSWDVANLFVLGASAFPQNAGYNPTGTVSALAFWAADAIRNRTSKPGTARRCVSIGSLARSVGATGAGVAILLAGSPRLRERRIRRNSLKSNGARYLAVASDCAAAIPSREVTLLSPAGGHRDAFGNIIAPNITPDRETGIGAWK